MNEILYNNVKKLLDSRNMSVRKLEMELGFSDKSVAKWKESMPSVDKVQKVADYFNVSIEELLGSEEVEPDEDLMDLREMLRKNPDAKILFDATKNATSEQINAVVEMIKAWKN